MQMCSSVLKVSLKSFTVPVKWISRRFFASKLIVKVYPGVMSQVLEGAEGLLRLPGG